MYPDTDSAPIPLANEYIEKIAEKLPVPLNKRFQQLLAWNVPPDTYTYLLRNNLVPLIEKINIDLGYNPIFVATLLAHRLKHLQGKIKNKSQFRFEQVYDLLAFIKQHHYTTQLAYPLIREIYLHPEMDFQSILHSIKFQPKTKEEILNAAQFLKNKFIPKKEKKKMLKNNWIMGLIRPQAIGNVELNEIYKLIES